jgi:copper transport protein
VRRAVAFALFAGIWILLTAPGAEAHALVLRSNPADGAVLEKPPSSVEITYTESPDVDLSVVHVLDSTGRTVESGKLERVRGDPLSVRVPLRPIGNGVYTVTWRVLSRVDGHVTGGSFSFGVGVAPVGVGAPVGARSAPVTPSPSPLAAAGRWALYWGLAVLVGGAATGLLVFGKERPTGRFLLILAWVFSAAGLVAMVLVERASVGVSLGRLLSSSTGGGLVRQAIALAVAGVAVGAFLVKPGRTTLVFLGVASAGTMWLHAQAGHAGAASSLRWFDVGVQWVHLLAVGVWIGGLVWLLLGVRGRETGDRVEAIRRFSWLAGIALAAVVLTGAMRAISEVGGPADWRRLFDTSFGVALLVKVGLAAGLIALGARNRYQNVPGIVVGTRPIASLRQTVWGEVLIAAAILGVTGVLTQLPPASSTASAVRTPAPAQVVVRGSDFATSVRVRLGITPGTIGPNRFAAVVTDYDTGKPVDANRVSLSFSLTGHPELGTPVVELSKVAGGIWAGQGTVISMDGRWDVSMLVQDASGSLEVPLVFTPRLPPQRVQVSRIRGQPTLYTIDLPGGASLQAYVDPGKAGDNTVHFTFFQTSGDEQPIASASSTAVTPAGAAEELPLTRFDAGHFVANVKLDEGHWRFRIQATTREGTVYDAYFEEHITP